MTFTLLLILSILRTLQDYFYNLSSFIIAVKIAHESNQNSISLVFDEK